MILEPILDFPEPVAVKEIVHAIAWFLTASYLLKPLSSLQNKSPIKSYEVLLPFLLNWFGV
jgi:hypothetical protein